MRLHPQTARKMTFRRPSNQPKSEPSSPRRLSLGVDRPRTPLRWSMNARWSASDQAACANWLRAKLSAFIFKS
jgi:hypothetical protein